jgi:threonine dehydrogenase-like Zn-dependent dehydrogenase
MKAVQIKEPGSVTLVDQPLPSAGPGEVLLKVEVLGLCGSDLNSFRGTFPMVRYPVIPGHEISATISALGSDVPAGLQVGQRVTVMPYQACGHCTACAAGRPNCCRENRTMGVQRDGAALEYLAVPYQKVLPAGSLGPEETACVEPLSVGWHAVQRLQVLPGERVLVLGCGVIGLGAVAAAAFQGAKVIAADVDDGKLGKAEALGATELINSAKADLAERVLALTDGDGAEAVVEAAGLAQTSLAAVEAACFGGRVALIGYVKGPVPLETKWFVSKELDVLGSRNALESDFRDVLGMLATGRVDVVPLISRRYPLEEAGRALVEWDRAPNEVTKILLHP